MNANTRKLSANTSVLVLVDVQDKLLAKIPKADRLVRNAGFLLDVAKLVQVSVRATEQYPKGLGPTTTELSTRLAQPPLAKTAFSCCGAGTFLEELKMSQKPDIVLAGMETHVCVAQTALDLLAAGLHVFLPVDALASQATIDHETALRRLEHAGAVVTTSEAVAFEWVADAAHPGFKAFSRMVVDRATANSEGRPLQSPVEP
jgi:nicotinamidase-related amidase